MSAAYYDIQAQQGSTLRLELTIADKNGKALTFEGNADGYVPLDELPEGFEERFINSDGESIAKVFIRMQVRNAIDGNLLVIAPPEDGTDGVNDLALFGLRHNMIGGVIAVLQRVQACQRARQLAAVWE